MAKNPDESVEAANQSMGFAKKLAARYYIGAAFLTLALSVGKTTLELMTGDISSLASTFSSASSIVFNAIVTGDSFSAAAGGLKKRWNSSRFGRVVGKIWAVVSSRPVKMALRVTGIVLACVAATTPLGWAVAGISIAAMAVSTIVGAVRAGRLNRLAAEAVDLESQASNLFPLTNTLIAQYLHNKLNPPIVGVEGRKVAAAAIGSNLLESTALIVSAFAAGVDSIPGLLTATAAGVGTMGGITHEAASEISNKEAENSVKREIERGRVKIVCVEMAANIANNTSLEPQNLEAMEAMFKETYEKKYPPKGLGKRIVQGFKDVARGIPGYIFGGLREVFFKNEAKSTDRAILSPQPDQASEVVKEIPAPVIPRQIISEKLIHALATAQPCKDGLSDNAVPHTEARQDHNKGR